MEIGQSTGTQVYPKPTQTTNEEPAIRREEVARQEEVSAESTPSTSSALSAKGQNVDTYA